MADTSTKSTQNSAAPADGATANANPTKGAQAAASGKPYDVDVKTAASTTLHVKPNETIHLHGLPFAHATVNVIGSDIVIADTASGHKVVLPGIGLFMFSADEAPHFVFDDQAVTTDSMLSKVGVVQNLTERDYVSFTSLDTSQTAQTQNQNTSTTPQIITVAAPEHISDAPEVHPIDITDDQAVARDTMEGLAAAQPVVAANGDFQIPAKSAHVTPFTSTAPVVPITPPASTSSNAASTTFEFDVRLLQVAATDNTATNTHTFLGGNGDENSAFDPSAASQYSTQTINTVASNANLTIYANNPAYFSSNEMTRVIEISPVVPTGFTVSSIVIGGLPSGFQILGATYDANAHTYTITNPVLDSRGDVELYLQYTNFSTQNFTLTIDTNAAFTPTSNVDTPANTTLEYMVTQGVRVQPVNSTGDYTYIDGNGNSDWVLATSPNANFIQTGNGNNIIYGGTGANAIQTGNGNNTIYAGSSNDTISTGSGNNLIYSGTGNDTVTGGTGTNTVNYSNTSNPVTVNLSQVNGSGYATAFVGTGKTDLLLNVQNITGGSGNDTFAPGPTSDVFDGGGGSNTIDYSGIAHALTINLGSGSVNLGNGNVDTLLNIQNVIGTNYGDTFISNGGGYQFTGGTGTNTIVYSSAPGAINVDLANPDGNGYVTVSVANGTADEIKNIENITGSAFNDTITGDANANIIHLGNGNNTVNSGGGGDLVYVGSGSNTIDGGTTGNNQLHFEGLTASGVIVNIAAGTESYAATGSLSHFSDFSTYYGTNQGDTFTGGSTAATIYGGTGNDTFILGTGTMTISGGGGTDTLSLAGLGTAATLHIDTGTATVGGVTDTFTGITNFLGSNNGDTIYDGTGVDNFTGGSGNDTVYANTGIHTLNGGGGTNTLNFTNATSAVTVNLQAGTATGWGTDTISNFQILYGSNNGDTLTASNSGSTIYGGNGNDIIYGGSGTDTLYGGGGINLFNAGSGVETIYAGNNGDTINAGSGTDTIYGGTGNDTINVGTGNATITGGGGTDTLSFSGLGNAAIIHLNTGSATSNGATDTFTGITTFIGTNHGDTVYDSTSNDNFTGGSGNDTVYANTGTHTLNGGGGTNTLSFVNATTAVTVNLSTTTAQNTGFGTDTLSNFQILYGSNNGGTLTASASGSTIYGGTGGTTIINGGSGTDFLYGGSGTTTLNGGSGTETITGGSGANTIIGGSGSDTIVAGSGTTAITTGNGTNSIVAGGGATDLITLGNGSNTLTNGGVNDTLSFASLGNAAIIHLNTGSATSNGATDTFSGITTFIGTNHGDTVYDSTSNDNFTGGSGNDTVYANTGTHTLNGGGGTNTLSFVNATTAVTVNLATTTAQNTGFGTDTISNFQILYGSNNGGTLTASASGSTIYGGTGGTTIINGGSGTDTLYGGSGANTIIGGSGTETITAGSGTTAITGGSGTDTIVAGGGATDLITLGNGTNTITNGGTHDTLSFAGLGNAATIHLNTGSATSNGVTDTFSGITNYIGTNHGDTVYDSTSNDNFTGGSGSDTVYANTGTHTLNGGAGTNTLNFTNAASAVTVNLQAGTASGWGTDTISNFQILYGSNNGDTLTASNAGSTIYGGNGNDIINGGSGTDTLYGGGGVNTINAGSGTETIYAGNNGDTITAGAGTDTITGGTGNDTIKLGTGSATVTGGGGADTLSFANLATAATIHLDTGTATVGAATDHFSAITYVIGTNNGDTVYTSTGTDNFTGGSGNDTVYANTGTHTLNGGAGTNTISFVNATTAVTVNLATTTAQNTGWGTDTLSNFNVVVASSHGDTITANTTATTIYGGAGSDTIYGGAGNDTVYASLGTDTIDGGAGSNTINFSNATSAVTYSLANTSSQSTGWDTLTTTNFQNYTGSNYGDTITGSTGNNVINGGSGNDVIDGGGGSDTINAGAGNDTIIGEGGGSDVINGGTGTNTLDYTNYTNSLTLNLNTGSIVKNGGADGTDTISNIQVVYGGQGTNVFTASTTQAYSMHGGYGSNTFIEQNSAYNDVIQGGSNSNLLNYSSVSGITANFQGASGTVSKPAGGIDQVSNVSQIIAGAGNDTFNIDGNALSYFTSIDGGAGTDTVKVVDNVAATTNVGSKLASIFTDIESINLSSMTKAGDTFGTISGDNVFHLLGTNGTLALSVKSGSALATSLTLGDGTTYTSHTSSTVGNVTTTTWFDASHTHSVILQVTAV